MRRPALNITLGLLASLAAAACQGTDSWVHPDHEPQPPQEKPIPLSLSLPGSCDHALDVLKAQLIYRMEMSLYVEEKDFLHRRGKGYFECNDPWWHVDRDDGVHDDDWSWEENWEGEESGDDGGDDGGEAGASDYSTTNTQVDGVDEADFVKNDGKFIYIVTGQTLSIFDAWPATQAHLVGSATIEGEPKKMHLYGDKVLVYSSLGFVSSSDPAFDYWSRFSGECTYGYDCDFTGDGRKLLVSTFDVSDKARPKLLRRTEYGGSYLNSRRIGDSVYTVVVFPSLELPSFVTVPPALLPYAGNNDCGEAIPFSRQEIHLMFEDLKTENALVIQALDIVELLPQTTDTVYSDGQGIVRSDLLGDCGELYIAGTGTDTNIIAVAGQSMSDSEPLHISSVMGKPGAVYADEDSLYLANRYNSAMSQNWFQGEAGELSELTVFHKFSLDTQTKGVAYEASGFAKGRLLNQFAMDEHDNHLRVAGTTGSLPSNEVHSTVTVLKQNEEDLQAVGLIDNIAPTEDIRSVRFDGDRGFVVTFKKTDPLFVLDFTDPKNPFVRGELKIPGYSTYMHLLDDHHLLTIGYDADEQGSFAFFDGVQLQIIDVSDLDHPVLAHKEIIGTRGSSSEAATNHLAFTYFRSRGWLAIPMTICEGGDNGTHGFEMTFSGLLVYRVDTEKGFSLLGGVPHSLASGASDDFYPNCATWWTTSNTQVKRSIFMEDTVYSIALDQMKVATIDDLEHPLASFDLPR
jgi:uncharacterized secreted protein with C-terminal beta-propeller domain